jgi:hypothetical protein
LHERAADQHPIDDFSRDRTGRHAHRGFPRGRAAAAPMIPDSIFEIISEIGVAGPVGVLDRVVVLGALIGVLDQERDRRSGRHLALGFFIMKNAGEDFDLIGFLALACEARVAGTPLVEEGLDVLLFERDQRRTAIDHAADRGTMAFAKSRHPEEMAEGVMGHGTRLCGQLFLAPQWLGESGETRGQEYDDWLMETHKPWQHPVVKIILNGSTWNNFVRLGPKTLHAENNVFS